MTTSWTSRYMLSRLSIRDIVLIDRLDIDFAEALPCSPARPAPASRSCSMPSRWRWAAAATTLVRQGVEQGQVTAVFEVDRKHPVWAPNQSNSPACSGVLRQPLQHRQVILADPPQRHLVLHADTSPRRAGVRIAPGPGRWIIMIG